MLLDPSVEICTEFSSSSSPVTCQEAGEVSVGVEVIQDILIIVLLWKTSTYSKKDNKRGFCGIMYSSEWSGGGIMLDEKPFFCTLRSAHNVKHIRVQSKTIRRRHDCGVRVWVLWTLITSIREQIDCVILAIVSLEKTRGAGRTALLREKLMCKKLL